MSLYYNFDTDKAFRVVGVFGDKMHIKEVSSHALRARMNAPTITLTFEQSFHFFKGYTKVEKAAFVAPLKQLHNHFKNN